MAIYIRYTGGLRITQNKRQKVIGCCSANNVAIVQCHIIYRAPQSWMLKCEREVRDFEVGPKDLEWGDIFYASIACDAAQPHLLLRSQDTVFI
jgi:hypothetical protein